MVNSFDNEADLQTALNETDQALVKFFATWCSPCNMYKVVFEKVAENTNNNDVNFFEVDIDKNPAVAKTYNVTSIPTTIFMKNGKETDKKIGTVLMNDLQSFLEENKNKNESN